MAVPAPDREPLASVCVSTRNRAALLPRLVHALEHQTIDPADFEVVIVDDGSTDDTPAVLADLAATTPLQLTLLRNPRSQGPAAGRNKAWRAGRGAVIAFTDDDCVPTPGWLAAGIDAVTAQHCIAVGRVIAHPDQLHLLGAFSYSLWVHEGVLLWFATANLFYRRSDLEAVNGFDENYRMPAGEDTDLGLRVVERGAEPVFVERALVYHDVRPSTLTAMLRDQARWADIPAVVARHPLLRRRALVTRVFWKHTHPRVLLLLAGLALSARDRRGLLLTLPWLHYRTCTQPPADLPDRQWETLPAMLALDVGEVVQMIRGSVRHRTLML